MNFILLKNVNFVEKYFNLRIDLKIFVFCPFCQSKLIGNAMLLIYISRLKNNLYS